VVAAADTHLHADFLSGATRLAARDGASVFASALGGREFPHIGLGDNDEVLVGDLTLRAWATPGHTGEHMSFVLLDSAATLGVFTGGSLLVGAAARTDLASPDQTGPLARSQYGSLQRLMTLEDETPVYPTHGAGSFCSAPSGLARVTTIGHERATNPLLQVPDEETFVARLLDSLGTFPPYFLRLPEINRRGPASPPPDATLPTLSPPQVLALRDRGARIVDVRIPADYAAGHVPGSLSITLRGVFATWLGWLIEDPSTPLLFVHAADQDPAEIVWQARKIGYDHLIGSIDLAAWHASGWPLAKTALVTAAQLPVATVVDVRQRNEYAAGHAPAALNIELGEIDTSVLPDGPIVAMCGHGERAATAASILESLGRADVTILDGGPDDLASATGADVEVSA